MFNTQGFQKQKLKYQQCGALVKGVGLWIYFSFFQEVAINFCVRKMRAERHNSL